MDSKLAKRIVGAAVLILLAVIFLPMLVKGPAPDGGAANVPLDTPKTPEGQFETRQLPLTGSDAVPAGATPADTAGGQPPALSTPATTAPALSAGKLPVSTAGGDWAVTFGAYASQPDADVVITRLREAGLDGFRQQATIGGQPAWRVRVGPYADRAQAEIARIAAVKVRGDVNASVIALDADGSAPPPKNPDAAELASPPPSQPKPPVSTPVAPAAASKPAAGARPSQAKPAPAAPAAPKPAPAVPKVAATSVGFAVQVGAFAQVGEANALRDRLRAAGFTASVQPVATEKGALNRVQVGPVPSRAEADALKAQVAAKMGVPGIIRPYP